MKKFKVSFITVREDRLAVARSKSFSRSTPTVPGREAWLTSEGSTESSAAHKTSTPGAWEDHSPLRRHPATFNNATHVQIARENPAGHHLKARPSPLTKVNARIREHDNDRLNSQKKKRSGAETISSLVLRPASQNYLQPESLSTNSQSSQGPTEIIWTPELKHFTNGYNAGPQRPQHGYSTTFPSPRSPPNAALLDPFTSTLVPLDRTKSFMAKFCTSETSFLFYLSQHGIENMKADT